MMKTQGITSKLSQGEKKKLRSLLTKKGRQTENKFLAEGVRLLEESIRHAFVPLRIYFSRAELNDRGGKLLEQFSSLKVPLKEIAARDLRHISDTETSQGLTGLFDIPRRNPRDIAGGAFGKILLLDRISDPGNAGALMRSALAFGFDLVFATEETVELYNPKVVRASVGALFGIPVITGAAADIGGLKKKHRCAVIITDPKGGHIKSQMKKLKSKKNFVLAIGSEAAGVSPEIRSMADFSIRIAHSDRVESLNAAVAGSILMKEIYDLTARKGRP